MTTTNELIRPDRTVAELATSLAGASRVFHRHGLDFCCHGHDSLERSCAAAGLDVSTVLEEIRAETRPLSPAERWDERPLDELIQHILDAFHEPHRAELPRLIEMARKVESVHAGKAACPRGLAEHLERMQDELELHMQKEEQVLFPLLRAGRGRQAGMPIQVMEQEHEDVARELERTRELTERYTPPAEACGTWRALYLDLERLEQDLMLHVHLENHVLFPGALRGQAV